MSNINCESCTNLMDYAAEFATRGVTNRVSASLKNNTGFNPSLTTLHVNCDDLNDANDCMVGRMNDEVEAYDVCDWKKFMHKFIPNLYEVLKAFIASMCGLWARVSVMCDSIDGIMNLVKGSAALKHPMTWVPEAKAKMFAVSGWDDTKWYMTLEAEIRNGVGCDSRKKMVVYRPGWGTDEDRYPYVFSFRVENLNVNDTLASIRKEDVVPTYMPERIWTDIMRGGHNYDFIVVNQDTILRVELLGYVVIDGIELNTQYKTTFGPDVMVLRVSNIIGTSHTGGATGAQDPLTIREF